SCSTVPRSRSPRRREDAADLEALAATAAGLDPAAGGADDVLDDREPEPGTARRAGGVGTPEAFEQAAEVRLRDAGAVVGADQHRRAVVARDLESEGGTVPGVADRVLDEVLRKNAQHPRPQR